VKEEGEAGWVAEQTEFLKLLRKKLDRYQDHAEHPKYLRLLLECQAILNRFDRCSPPKQPQTNL